MSTYDNTNKGVLFKKDKKGNDKAPDYTGKLNVQGKDWALAAWVKESKAGTKFLSISLSEPRVKAQTNGDQPF